MQRKKEGSRIGNSRIFSNWADEIRREIWRERKTEAEKREDKRAIDDRSKSMRKRENMMNHYEIPLTLPPFFSLIVKNSNLSKNYTNLKGIR